MARKRAVWGKGKRENDGKREKAELQILINSPGAVPAAAWEPPAGRLLEHHAAAGAAPRPRQGPVAGAAHAEPAAPGRGDPGHDHDDDDAGGHGERRSRELRDP